MTDDDRKFIREIEKIRIININVTKEAGGHTSYRNNMEKILQRIKFID